MKVAWSPLAIERAVEQAAFIALDKPEAAQRWLSGLFEAAKRLADLPRLGRVVAEIGVEEIREIDFRGTRIVYRLEAKRVAILTVRHGRRQFDLGEVDRTS